MRLRPIVAALVAIAGLPAAATAAPVLGPQAYYGMRIAGPLDENAEPVNRAADYSGPHLELMSTYLGRRAIEPTVALDKLGNAFIPASYFETPVYGIGGHTYLMRSTDGGRSWHDIEPATEVGYDPPRDLDPWVWGDPDTGRVFDVGLLFAGSYLSYTDDGGETWQSTALTDPGLNDHQTIVAAPPPPKNPMMVPSDPAFPKILYYCVNEVSRTGCTASRDGGETWISTPGSAYVGVATTQDELPNPVCSSIHGHIQADRDGRVFVPAGHCGLPQIAITEDGGTTWERVVVNKDIRSAERHNEVAVDQAGNLYYVWYDPVHWLPWMATSTDHGRTWSDAVMIAPPGVHAANFPTIVAGEPGRVAITFTGTTEPDEESRYRPWNAYVLMSTNALVPEPLFISTIANQAGDPIHRGACRSRCSGVFDFADIQLSPVDGTIWATSSDSCIDDSGCNDSYNGELPPSGTPGPALGFSIHQTGGPKLVGPLPPAFAAPQPAPAQGRPAQPDRTRPRVRLGMTRRSFRVRRPRGRRIARAATRFTLRLSESATVAIRIDRVRGRRARRIGVLRTSAAAGLNRLPFTGKVGRGYLRRGTYRAIAVVSDGAGNVGRSRAVRFRVR